MKKLFFSAVALVAFSSTSMANCIAVEEIKETIKIEVIESDYPCADAWAGDVEFFQNYLGVSLRKAMRLADLAFEKCLDDTYGN
jgi:hypothetical protein